MAKRRNPLRNAERPISLVADVVAIGSFLVAVILWIVSQSTKLPQSERDWIFGVAIFALGLAIGILVAWLARRHQDGLNYRIISVEKTYQFDEANPRIQRLVSCTVIEATRGAVYTFTDMTNWSGAKDPVLQLLSTDQALWVIPFVHEGWRPYVIALREPLLKNDRVEIILQAEFHALADDSVQWVGHTPQRRISDSLTLRIAMGRNAPPVNQFSAVIMKPGLGASAVQKRLPVSRDGITGLASVTFKRPRLGLRHDLRVNYTFLTDPDEIRNQPIGQIWPAL